MAAVEWQQGSASGGLGTRPSIVLAQPCASCEGDDMATQAWAMPSADSTSFKKDYDSSQQRKSQHDENRPLPTITEYDRGTMFLKHLRRAQLPICACCMYIIHDSTFRALVVFWQFAKVVPTLLTKPIRNLPETLRRNAM